MICPRQNGTGMGWSIATVRVERLDEGRNLAKKHLSMCPAGIGLYQASNLAN